MTFCIHQYRNKNVLEKKNRGFVSRIINEDS